MSANLVDEINCFLNKRNYEFDNLSEVNYYQSEMLTWKFLNPNVENWFKNLKKANDIAELERANNNGQPIQTTLEQIHIANNIIKLSDLKSIQQKAVNALNYVPITEVLVNCAQCLKNDGTQITLLLNNGRAELLKFLFEQEPIECVENQDADLLATLQIQPSPLDKGLREQYNTRFAVNQVICDKSDLESAVDMLILNLSNRLPSPWRIQNVLVQENLKDKFLEYLRNRQLSVMNDTRDQKAVIDENNLLLFRDNMNGQLVQNDSRTISLLMNIPRKYVDNLHVDITTVNFFRTPKEIVRLIKNEKSVGYTSLWTENIGLFYEIALSIDSFAVWNNCIGVFEDVVPCPLACNNWSQKPNTEW